MYSYRSPAIGDLAAQLKRGPRRLRLKQLHAIEFLLSVIEPDRHYPYEFIMHTLTGYRRPPGSGQASAESALLHSEAIRGDLITLAEDISAEACLSAERWVGVLYSVRDLSQRFDVSTKTIFRWHRRGLVGWRFRFADRRTRLAFPERSVRRFVAENAELVHRGSSFSQLTPSERLAIIARAKVLAEAGGQTVNAVAKRISVETGRAVETIRLILKAYDESHAGAGIFNRSKLCVAVDDDRLRIWEAYADGATVEALARRFERPVQSIYRTITEMRARELKARTIEFVFSEEFAQAEADAAILRDPALANPTVPALAERRIPPDLPPYLRQLFRVPLLTPAGEVALFRKLNYLRYRADQLRRRIDAENTTARELDRIEALLDESAAVKNQIVQANLRLVVSIAKRHVSPTQDFWELVSDGNVSLMRAVDKFDFTRGFKFSTYASWAIMKNFARSLPEQGRQRERLISGREELLDRVASPPAEEFENEHLPAVRASVERMLAALDERERVILRQRYGLDSYGEPQTLEQIGRRLGVSKERVRQLEARAMSRLRTDFQAEWAQLLGRV